MEWGKVFVLLIIGAGCAAYLIRHPQMTAPTGVEVIIGIVAALLIVLFLKPGKRPK